MTDLRKVAARASQEHPDPVARRWFGELATGADASSVDASAAKVIVLDGSGLLAASAWWDTASRRERLATERWWLAHDR